MKKIKPIVFCALFTTLMAVGALIKIPGPLLPMTLQTFFAVLCGLLLGEKGGFCSMLIYMLIGLLGVPVFTEGGGIGYLLRPSFGYVIGFCACAYCTGRIARKANTFPRMLLSSLCGLCVLYTIGLVYYTFLCHFVLELPLTVRDLVLFCFLLPLPGDIICVLLASRIAGRLRLALSLSFPQNKKS